MYNNERKEQVFASNSKFQIKESDNKSHIASHRQRVIDRDSSEGDKMTAKLSTFMQHPQIAYQTEQFL